MDKDKYKNSPKILKFKETIKEIKKDFPHEKTTHLHEWYAKTLGYNSYNHFLKENK